MGIRNEIVAYAKQFEGNPYVYGGTSLTHGTDCSGFTQAVFRDKGITIPRTSRMQAAEGRPVSITKVQPADLIFYSKYGIINHVALYIGGGMVISAGSKKTGIQIMKYNYRKPCKAVSYI
jgi:cell wall-associated NlpC family hydrolase